MVKLTGCRWCLGSTKADITRLKLLFSGLLQLHLQRVWLLSI